MLTIFVSFVFFYGLFLDAASFIYSSEVCFEASSFSPFCCLVEANSIDLPHEHSLKRRGHGNLHLLCWMYCESL